MKEKQYSFNLVIPPTRFSIGEEIAWRKAIFRVAGVGGGEQGNWRVVQDSQGDESLVVEVHDRWYNLVFIRSTEVGYPWNEITVSVETIDSEATIST